MQRILIVEDEDILRQAYVNIFTIEKFHVQQAANGKLALDVIKSHKPNIIILDILMPVMDGISFLEAAKLADNYPDVKVLVLSNLSDKSTIEKVIKLGATQHLVKSSLSPSQLVASVRTMLS